MGSNCCRENITIESAAETAQLVEVKVDVMSTREFEGLKNAAAEKTAETADTSNADAELVEAEAASCEFTIRLKKDNPQDRLGLKLMRSVDGTQVVIEEPSGKVMEEWNARNPTMRVLAGDELVSVCGISGDGFEIVRALGTPKSEVDIVLRRWVLPKVVIAKKKGPLGLTFNPETLELTGIKDGPIAEYNQTCPLNHIISIGDQLVGLNDVVVDLADALQKLREGDPVTLIFKRPPVTSI